jgi:hypothetical protein
MRISSFPVFFPLILVASCAFAQGEDPRHSYFRESLRHATDSLLAVQRSYADSLFRHGDVATGSALALLESCIDSLVKEGGDSLDGQARDRLHYTELGMRTTLGVLGFPARLSVRSLLRSFETELPALMGRRSVCAGCSTPAGYEAAEKAFLSEADTLGGVCGDSMAGAVQSWEEALDDSVVVFTDSVDREIGRLKSEYAERRASQPVSRLVASGSAVTHTNYRGRDDGVTESAFGSSLTYHHKSGLYAGGAIGWVSRPEPGPDDGSLTAGYEFDLSARFDGSVSYTRYWYSDSSTLPRAATNQSIEGIFTLDLDALNVLGIVSYDFGGGGGGAEFTTSLDVSKDILVPGRTLGGNLILSPALGATWGDQDERLLQRRIQRVKKKSVVVRSVKPAVIFGIMEYEFSFPASLHLGRFSVEPMFEYIIPADVLDSGRSLLNKDPSTPVPFVSCALTLTMTVE